MTTNSVCSDNSITRFCSVQTGHRGFNFNVFLQNIEKEDKGWKHRRSFYKAYDAVFCSSDQEVWDGCLYIFHNFDVEPMKSVLNMERVKKTMKRIHTTKRMTSSQRKLLEFFFASVAEEKHTLKMKCRLYA